MPPRSRCSLFATIQKLWKRNREAQEMAIIRTFETGDGKQVEARIINVSRDATQAQVGLVAKVVARALSRDLLSQASEQIPLYTSKVTLGKWQTEEPPISLDKLVALARSEPMHRSCCNAKAAAIVGQGYKVRPASEFSLSETAVAGVAESNESPDPEGRAQIIALTESGLPDSSFTETFTQMQLDKEIVGQGFVEILRDSKGKPDGIVPVKAVTIRLLAGRDGYVQSRGGTYTLFAKYTAGGGKTAQVTKRAAEDKRRKTDFDIDLVSWGDANKVVSASRLINPSEINQELMQAEDGTNVGVSTNELLMWKKATPYDTNYGESDIVAAMYDAVGGQLSAVFNMDYFESSTIPRLAIIAKGGTMSNELISRIQDYFSGRNAPSLQNQVLLVDFSDKDVDLVFQQLGASQLEDASFSNYRNMVDEHIRMVHQVPPSMVAMTGDELADFRFLSQVVRPEQRAIESKLNYIFRNDLKIVDWVIDLNVPDLLGERRRAEIWDILLRRGVASINEVRSFYGLSPIEGGDIPFVLVPGQGVVPTITLEHIVEAIKSGAYTPGEVTASSPMKTPRKGDPLFEPPGKVKQALSLEVADLSYFSDEVRQDMALILEQMAVIDPDTLAEMIPGVIKDRISSNR